MSPASESDLADIRRLYSDAKTREFLGGTLPSDIAGQKFEELMQDAGNLTFAVRIKANDAFAGTVSLAPHYDDRDIEVSFQFLPDFWGMGLAEETVSAAIRFAIDTLHLSRVVAETQSANTRSRALLEKLGMSAIKTVTRFDNEQVIYSTDPKAEL